MGEAKHHRIVGVLCIVTPVAMGLFFFLLTRTFHYPKVLDRTPYEVLNAVGGAGSAIHVYWLGVLLSAVLMMALVTALHGLLSAAPAGRGWPGTPHSAYLPVVTIFGVFAALFMILDLAQWVWLYPKLGHRLRAHPSETAALELEYRAWHEYLGRGIGIYLATLFNALWAGGLGLVTLNSLAFPRWISWLGVAAGLLFAVSIVPGASFDVYSVVNSIGFAVWAVWLVAMGLVLIRRRDPPGQPA